MTEPRDPIEFGASNVSERNPRPPMEPGVVDSLRAACATSTDPGDILSHSRDWWPLAMHWALAGETHTIPSVVCRPRSTEEVCAVVRVCAEHGVPITPMAGRSSVTGAAAPVAGGVALDMTSMSRVLEVDPESGVVCCEPGVFGPDLEREMSRHGLTVGHYPQSFDISTVGGWVASRGAGQYSTRYGKIEDIVVGLEVVLADARVLRLGPTPAAAQGPDLLHLFLGSEGTLGVITKVWMRAHPLPDHRVMRAYSFPGLSNGVSAMRNAVRHGATPAVLRLYDEVESARSHGATDGRCTLLVLDEGNRDIVSATLAVVDEVAADNGGRPEPEALVEGWLEHRNDVSALAALTHKGYVIDTMEVSAHWSAVNTVVARVKDAASTVAGIRNASVHLSHSYLDGACLYFTFAVKSGTPNESYVELWDAVQRAALASGANLSHHHGIGVSRARFMREALGETFQVLLAVKRALDPDGIFNPGKLGLGRQTWP